MKKVIMGVLLILMLMVAPLTAETATSAITLSGLVAKQFSVTPSTTTYAFLDAGVTGVLHY